VLSRFRIAIEETEALLQKVAEAKLGPAPFDPEAIPARKRFLNRRLKLLRNLWRWRKYTGEKIGVDTLLKRLVEGGIMKVSQEGWDVGGKEVAQQVRSLCSH